MSDIVWLSSPNGPNANHKAYINSLNHDLYFTNTYLKSFDNSSSKIKRYISWFINAIFFKNRKKYKLFFSIGEHVHLVLMKKLGFLSKNQKIICFHCTETLYFIKEHRYSTLTEKFLLWVIKNFDGHLCVSQMTADLLREITKKEKNIYPIFNGVPTKQKEPLAGVKPLLDSHTIIFIGNLYSDWRLWYKGVDLLFDTINILRKKYDDIKLIVVGSIEENFHKQLNQKYDEDTLKRIILVGKTLNLAQEFSKSALYLHPARGEAFGISVLEAMAAGVPTLISEWTGAKEVVSQVSNELIFPLSIDKIVEKVIWYFELPIEEKAKLSNKSRIIANEFSQEKSIANLKEVVNKILKDFNLL